MRFFVALTFFMLIRTVSTYGQLNGKIIDNNGTPLPYVTIYTEQGDFATYSNIEGKYNVELPQGQYVVVYQYMGLSTVKENITIGSQKVIKNITLIREDVSLPEITVGPGGEDPAYPIMRKAIAARQGHYDSQSSFKARVYTKGMIKLTNAPNKIMGKDLGDLGGILDSNRQGIIYLSESDATYYCKKPNLSREVIHKSIVSGEDNGLTFNQFSNAYVDLYEESPEFMRTITSPLSDDAFQFYRYKLVGSYIGTHGRKVYQISMLPKNDYRACFQGDIHIAEDGYAVYALDAFLDKKSLDQGFIDTVRLLQYYKLSPANQWIMVTQTLGVDFTLMIIKGAGTFNYILSEHEAPYDQPKSFYKEQIKMAPSDDTNQLALWDSIRPIPLTDIEARDYVKKDSLKIVWKSKPYLDSLDKKSNNFGPMDLVFGYTYRNSFKKYAVGLSSLLNSASFNPVEGLVLKTGPFFTKLTENGNIRYKWSNDVSYGVTDQKWKGVMDFILNSNKFGGSEWGISGGRKYVNINPNWQMGTIGSTINSLVFKNYYNKMYGKDFVLLTGEIGKGNVFFKKFGVGWSDRFRLENNTNFSFYLKDKRYQENNHFGNIQSTKEAFLSGLIEWRPGLYSVSSSNMTIAYENSKLPRFGAYFRSAIPLGDEYVDYTKVGFYIRENSFDLKRKGHLTYFVGGETFLRKEKTDFQDVFHYEGLEAMFKLSRYYYNSFQALPYYQYSSTTAYGEGHIEYHEDGWITEKIPLLRGTRWHLVFSAKTLARNDFQYNEWGAGFENIKIKAIELFRADFYYGRVTEGENYYGIRFGLSDVFVLGRN